jgi:hypothetical protein
MINSDIINPENALWYYTKGEITKEEYLQLCPWERKYYEKKNIDDEWRKIEELDL